MPGQCNRSYQKHDADVEHHPRPQRYAIFRYPVISRLSWNVSSWAFIEPREYAATITASATPSSEIDIKQLKTPFILSQVFLHVGPTAPTDQGQGQKQKAWPN